MSAFLTYAPIVALLFFVMVYLWILFCTLRPGAKQVLQPHAQIPLQEEIHGR